MQLPLGRGTVAVYPRASTAWAPGAATSGGTTRPFSCGTSAPYPSIWDRKRTGTPKPTDTVFMLGSSGGGSSKVLKTDPSTTLRSVLTPPHPPRRATARQTPPARGSLSPPRPPGDVVDEAGLQQQVAAWEQVPRDEVLVGAYGHPVAHAQGAQHVQHLPKVGEEERVRAGARPANPSTLAAR